MSTLTTLGRNDALKQKLQLLTAGKSKLEDEIETLTANIRMVEESIIRKKQIESNLIEKLEKLSLGAKLLEQNQTIASRAASKVVTELKSLIEVENKQAKVEAPDLALEWNFLVDEIKKLHAMRCVKLPQEFVLKSCRGKYLAERTFSFQADKDELSEQKFEWFTPVPVSPAELVAQFKDPTIFASLELFSPQPAEYALVICKRDLRGVQYYLRMDDLGMLRRGRATTSEGNCVSMF